MKHWELEKVLKRQGINLNRKQQIFALRDANEVVNNRDEVIKIADYL